MYTADDLRILKGSDVLTWVRSKSGIFFSAGVPNPIELSRLLVRDALVLGAERVDVRHRQDWWAVGSELDWLIDERYAVDELFHQLVSFPQAGQNESRSEILITAFAEHAATATRAQAKQVVGDHSGVEVCSELLDQNREWNRCVAFTLSVIRHGE